jgi:hypothetical protein
MNMMTAFEELDIPLDLNNINEDYLKKQYRKMALKWHPDKNKEPGANQKFQRINDAYEYLLNVTNDVDTDTDNNKNADTDNNYLNILNEFIKSLIKSTSKEDIINKIVMECNNITEAYLKHKFEELDKEVSLEIYHFLYKYKDILYISDNILELVSLTIKEKLKNDRIFILKPELSDIMNHNIYKLVVDDSVYLVPLWHSELYFDAPNNSEIIVLCQPKLPPQVLIDEHNNIYYNKDISINCELSYLIKDKYVSFELGGKWFSIPLDKLYIKEEQNYRFKGQGIAQIIDTDMYDIKTRGDVNVKIKLINI